MAIGVEAGSLSGTSGPRSTADIHAAAILALADRVSRLPACDPRIPDAFHEGKSDIAAALKEIAHKLTGRISRPSTKRRPRTSIESLDLQGRRVMVVRRKRPAFAVG
jgi:hypothetical protein